MASAGGCAVTPRQEGNIERSVGRIEAQLASISSYLEKVDGKLDAADEWRREVKTRLEAMESHSKQMDKVSGAFNALQQSIHDGKMQAKGMVIGVGVAAGAGGATVATFIKWAWATLTGA